MGNNNYNKNKIVFNIFVGFDITCSLICIYFQFINNFQYGLLWLLPLTYTMILILSTKNKNKIGNPGITVLNIIMFMRYIILPLTIYYNDSLSIYASQYKYINEAVLFMLYEMVIIFATIGFTQVRKGKGIRIIYTQDFNFKRKKILVGIIIIIAVGILFNNKALIGNTDIFTGIVSDSLLEDYNNISGVITIIWQTFLLFIFLYYLYSFKRKFETSHSSIYFYMSLFLSIIYLIIVYIGQIRISRWFMLVSGISIFYILSTFYKEHRRKLMLIFLVPIIVLLISATILKNTTISGNYSMWEAIEAIFTPTNIDTYFAGPVNVNNAIYMKLKYQPSLLTIFPDVLNNFPYLNHFIDKSTGTIKLYNLSIFGTDRKDQIIPLLGQSFSYFGYIFSPLLTSISVSLVLRLDNLARNRNDIMKYLFTFTAVWLSLASILNMTIMLSWFYSRIIPMYVLLVLYRIKIKN